MIFQYLHTVSIMIPQASHYAILHKWVASAPESKCNVYSTWACQSSERDFIILVA